jgi:hypothetical protein
LSQNREFKQGEDSKKKKRKVDHNITDLRQGDLKEAFSAKLREKE